MKMPALLTSTSMWPNRSSATSNKRLLTSGRPMSPSIGTKRSGDPSASDAFFRRDSVRAFPMTEYPRSSNARVIARPIPLEAPVTIAVFVSISILLVALVRHGERWRVRSSSIRWKMLFSVFLGMEKSKHGGPQRNCRLHFRGAARQLHSGRTCARDAGTDRQSTRRRPRTAAGRHVVAADDAKADLDH